MLLREQGAERDGEAGMGWGREGSCREAVVQMQVCWVGRGCWMWKAGEAGTRRVEDMEVSDCVFT